MTSGRKTYFYSLIIACLTMFPFPGQGIVRASSLSVNMRGSLIDLRAEQAPLIEILKAISEKAGIALYADDSMTDPVSLELNGVSLEKCLRRLLTHQNYTLLFEKDDRGSVVPVEIRVVGGQAIQGKTRSSPPTPGSTRRVSPASTRPPGADRSPSAPEDPMKKYEKAWFERAFEDSKKLSGQAAGDLAEDGSHIPGVRITRISRGSVFDRIGLKAGDIVHNVDGKAVESVEELIEVLQKAPEEQTMIRIERTRKNNQMDPIYIELH